jgi:hypothetical protein
MREPVTSGACHRKRERGADQGVSRRLAAKAD